MLPRLHYTLLADGSSDRVLARFIDWALFDISAVRSREVVPQVADLRTLPDPPRELSARMSAACEHYPCDILFVHRDAERASLRSRVEEIRRAAELADLPPHVPVVPVRMTEAWLLVDESAIRAAADNPYGSVSLALPPISRLEHEADPKTLLRTALESASEKQGRHLKRFRRDLSRRVARVADYLDDFAVLRSLSAFRAFESELRRVVAGALSDSTSE